MAHAVKELFPEAKVTIGPAIENRFYYDFDIDGTFSDEDLGPSPRAAASSDSCFSFRIWALNSEASSA